jgi:hypothetical protein
MAHTVSIASLGMTFSLDCGWFDGLTLPPVIVRIVRTTAVLEKALPVAPLSSEDQLGGCPHGGDAWGSAPAKNV